MKIYKKRSKTTPVSVRLDSDLLDYVRSKNLNLSFTLNALLRGYLYIQKYDEEAPVFGSSRFSLDSVKIDVYFKDSLDCEL